MFTSPRIEKLKPYAAGKVSYTGYPTRYDEDNEISELKLEFDHSQRYHITVRRQDLFSSNAQVIVNAANTHLGGGGEIDGLIHQRGGDTYNQEHQKLQKLYNSKYSEGFAACISSGALLPKYNISHVIVVAGPQPPQNNVTQEQLYNCYYNSLKLAHQMGQNSIAFPSISTGIFEYPLDSAAEAVLQALYDFTKEFPQSPLTTISIHFLPNEDVAKSILPYQKTSV